MGECEVTQVAFVQFFIFALVVFLAFFHYCVYSNVWSNFLPGRMERHTHYMCLAFLRCVFKMCPQMACREDANSRKLHLFNFSYLHWLHFSPMQFIVHFQRSPQISCPREDIFAFFGFSPMCISNESSNRLP